MATEIHHITNLENFIQEIARPNPNVIYLLMPQDYVQLEKLHINITNTLVYTDLYINKILKLYQSFTPEIIESPERFVSPILLNIQNPLVLDKKILNEPLPIDIIIKNIMASQAVNIVHIPKPVFRWNQKNTQ